MRRTTIPVLIAAGLLCAPDLPARGAEAEKVRPAYRRSQAERPALPRPAARGLPESLRIKVPADPAETRDERDDRDAREGAARTRRPHPPPPDREFPLEERAREAAAWAAREAIQRFGRPAYYELGLYEGLQEAFRDPRIGRWDLREGDRFGRLDPEARRIGSRMGHEASLAAAGEAAAEAVYRQFADLAREPVRRFDTPPARFPPLAFGVHEPVLVEVFREFPLERHVRAGFRGRLPDPWRLYRCRSYDDLHDRSWSTGEAGFRLWLERSGEGSFYRRLGEEDRQVFKGIFVRSFERRLAERFAHVAERAFDRGFADGWDYGALVRSEWSYRRGYSRGFETAVGDAARNAFYDGFPRLYADAYDDLFREWSTRAKPEIRGVTLADGDDDGVFQPGEPLAADFEVVNLGGAAARLEARLSGPALAREAVLPVALPRRSVFRPERPLAAAVDAGAAPGTETELSLTLGDLLATVPLRVSYPLEIDRRFRLAEHDALAGSATVELLVRNASRRIKSARFDAAPSRGRLKAPSRSLALAAGASETLRLRLADLHPLDLLAGEVDVSVTVAGPRAIHDRLDLRLPELATDLEDRSLLRYLVLLASQEVTDPAAVARAQELMLRRLGRDWRAAVAASGNPYRRDLRRGTSDTALGDLVATYRRHRPHLAHPGVFSDLAPEIRSLARSFGGVHPWLRKSMKKLARELAG